MIVVHTYFYIVVDTSRVR